ncbi:diguanylate cyclase [Novosphingopyxis sp.]|uniref:sensor domain-containing diguanylate cyclase n=1 Tax=Novosphingopyxis sp. TaxID=2709690 RepID=UPI003B5AD60F
MAIPWNRDEIEAPCLIGDTAQMLLQMLRSEELDALIALARATFGCKAAAISILGERQWFLSSAGLDMHSTGRNEAICLRTLANQELTVFSDLSRHPETRDNPLVAREGGFRFYAGVPLSIEPDFFSMNVLAAFCIIDDAPRELSPEQHSSLEQFASIARSMVENSVLSAGSRGRATMQADLVEKLVRKQVQFRQAEMMAQMGHWRLDLASETVDWSEGVFEIHGLPVSETPPLERALSFYRQESRAQLEQLIARAIATGEPYEADLDIITCDGRRKRVRTRGEAEFHEGKLVALIGVFRDVTERYALERRLRRAAQTDPLTGLGNREAMRAFFDNRGEDEKLSVMLLDLDGFKQVNDRLGHLAGDAVIQTMAQHLRRMVPAPHFVGRFGGDEFVVILMDDALTEERTLLSDRVARGMIQEVENNGTALTVSASIGMCKVGKGESLEHALSKADTALYAAKRATKGSAAA